jgi:hypothetical protein
MNHSNYIYNIIFVYIFIEYTVIYIYVHIIYINTHYIIVNSKTSKSWTFLVWTLKPGVVLWSSWDSQFSVMEWGPGAEPQSPGLMATSLGSEDIQRIAVGGNAHPMHSYFFVKKCGIPGF